ncbi:hypothetical protein V5799_033228 [Amblyomma americanum]|uniref:Uncharacterized protein n=1 Tax=Amblyomma americanum TaxID=6943 RepID=A0AAQ4DNX3_AMBAM
MSMRRLKNTFATTPFGVVDVHEASVTPALLVAYGHYTYCDISVDTCAITPPTRLSAVPLPTPFRGDYPYDLIWKVKNETRDVTYAIIACDVDYDDQCGSLNKFGKHGRLKALCKIVDYYKSPTEDKFNEASCSKVVY